jgi:hypothetical protein
MFDHVVTTRYWELRKIAKSVLDGGKIPGTDDCVQKAISDLLLDGSYAVCAGEGQMFSQLLVTVRNRAKATIKRSAKDRKTLQSLATDDWHDDDDGMAGEGRDRDLSLRGKCTDIPNDSELLPRCIEQTRDLRVDATRALCEEPVVPMDVQLILVGETTRRDLLENVDPRNRHLRGTILNNRITDSRERLAKRLNDYQPVPRQKR